MIHELKRTINFTEYIPPKRGREKDTSTPPKIVVNTKYQIILFGKKSLTKLGMEGKFIKFYYEATRKIIGWTLVDKLNEAQFKNGKYRLVKANTSGAYRASITGILDQFKGLDKESYSLEVMKYVEREGVLERGTNYFFVQLKEEYDDSK